MEQNAVIKRVGIMGGTFDPIHYGHLASAETVRHEFCFDKIIFIPSGSPPHKTERLVSDSEKRYLMTSYAIASNDFFDISRIEIDRKGKTYTIDTINEIKKSFDAITSIYFITGADALFDILTWHNAGALLKICSFIAITRPGFDKNKTLSYIEYLKNTFGADIAYMEVPALAISSSNIRARVKAGQPVKYLLPDSVEAFIKKHSMYTGGP